MTGIGKNEITTIQYVLLIHGTQVGIGVLTMPRELASIAGTDGWMSIVLGWGIAVVASLLLLNAMKHYPDKTIVEILPLLLGKWLGNTAVVLIALYCLFGAVTVFAYSVSLINIWLLSQTPGYIIVILFIIPLYQVMKGGVRVLGRYSELIFYLTLWMFPVLFFTWPKLNGIHLLPLFKEGWKPILQASQSTILSFLGFELAFFWYPFLQRKQYAVAGMLVANTLSMLVFLTVTILCYSLFSPDEITQFTWPTLGLCKVIEFRFLERFDIVFLAFYLFVLSTTGIPYMYLTVFSTSRLLGSKNHLGHLKLILLLIAVAAVIYTPSFSDLTKMVDYWGRTGMVIGYAIPCLLAGVLMFMGKKAGERSG